MHCAVPSGGQTRSDTTDQSLANNSLGLEEMEILITLCLSSVCPQIVCLRGCTFTPDAFVPVGADVWLKHLCHPWVSPGQTGNGGKIWGGYGRGLTMKKAEVASSEWEGV